MQFLEAKKWDQLFFPKCCKSLHELFKNITPLCGLWYRPLLKEENMARKCDYIYDLPNTKSAPVVKSKLIASFDFSDLSDNSLSSIETGSIEDLEQLVLL